MAGRVCPWWLGYFLLSPVRKLSHNPPKILGSYVRPGMTVVDVGCAMGFFSLPLAVLVGPQGSVVCVDLQEKMIASLKRRAQKAGLLDRLQVRVCCAESLGLKEFENAADFALAFAVVHEVPNPAAFFGEVLLALKPEAHFLVVEPKLHVSQRHFESSVLKAKEAGFIEMDRPNIARSRAILFRKSVSEK